jgi:transcriptional regulator with XRE-family HTH domain
VVNAQQLGRAHCVLRKRLRLRQQDVADQAGVSRAKVSRLERGLIAGLQVSDVARCFEVLGARLELVAVWQGAGLDRVLDEGHARLLGQVARLLRELGWQVEVEVTFSHYGDRGSIDLLAWHAAAQMLLVIEIKSELGSVDGLLRPLDVKVRLAPAVARERFGWPATRAARLVVLPEERSVRRTVERHAAVLSTALPVRSRDVRRWLRAPSGPISGLWFLSPDRSLSVMRNPSAVQRVRLGSAGAKERV